MYFRCLVPRNYLCCSLELTIITLVQNFDKFNKYLNYGCSLMGIAASWFMSCKVTILQNNYKNVIKVEQNVCISLLESPKCNLLFKTKSVLNFDVPFCGEIFLCNPKKSWKKINMILNFRLIYLPLKTENYYYRRFS